MLEVDPKRFGFVRSRSAQYKQTNGDPYIPQAVVAKYGLRPGAVLEGTATPRSNRSPEVDTITAVNGLNIDRWMNLKEFSQHEVVSPFEHVRLEGKSAEAKRQPGNISMRIVDLFCPIGKGQRALIVSPPKAGKTMLMP